MKHFALIAPLTMALATLPLVGCVEPVLTIQPAELPNAVEDQDYEVQLTADGETDVDWNARTADLPPGLTLSSRGLLAGEPTTPGTYEFTIYAEDDRGLGSAAGSATYTITVIEQLEIDDDLDIGRVDEAYDASVPITGGVEPYVVTIDFLPAGLQQDGTTARIFGTPINEYDARDLRVTVTDAGDPQQTTIETVTLVVRPEAVAITTTSLPAAAVDTAYSQQLTAINGNQPYTWAVIDGAIPGISENANRLRLDSATGTISGVPGLSATTGTFTVQVSDSNTPPSTDTIELKLVINVTITTASLPAAIIGEQYNQALGAGAGLPPYTWSLAHGSAPPEGLQLSANGVVSGIPTAAATTQTFTAIVTDSDDPATSASQEITIEVTP